MGSHLTSLDSQCGNSYPVNPGHALIVSRRQISYWWEATTEENTDLMALVDEVRARIAE
jgi:diadenosine tetraphosphate (Ap4A) HIT family hydrolase